jgi:hypothetical protein
LFILDRQDYTPLDDVVLSFAIGSFNGREICTEIQIIDNEAFEKTEHFYIRITSEENVVIRENSAPVYIIDDDGMVHSLSSFPFPCFTSSPSPSPFSHALPPPPPFPPSLSFPLPSSFPLLPIFYLFLPVRRGLHR